MGSNSGREQRVLWSFWIACGLAATGAIAPIVLAPGDLSRALGVAIPFALAAILLGVMALTYPRGKSWATGLYILTWIAVVYGILRMIAVPLQQAVIGACPVSADVCAPGLSRPFGTGETVAIAVGGPESYATTPPTRVIPTRTERAPAAEPEPVATPPSSAPEPPVAPAPATPKIRKPRAKRKAAIAVEPARDAEQAELPAHEDAAELPAHIDPNELPPHPSSTTADP
jgi:hypothetical protein